MTPAKLVKTLAFLQLTPRRLVRQGLAPKGLLVRMTAEAKKNKGDNDENNEDLSESVAADMELMSVEDDKKEWNDGFVSVEPAPAAAAAARATAAVVDSDNAAAAEDTDDSAAPATAAKKKNALHEAFITAGIKLRPREVRPLLLALDVRPRRLVKLGYVDDKYLRNMLEAEKKANHKRGNGAGASAGLGPRQRMARGCGGARGAGGPGGKPCGRMMMMRRNVHPVAHPPPPPPAFMVEEDGVCFVPVKRRGGGGGHGVGRCGPPHGPPPHHKRHGRHAGGPEDGEEGASFHRGPRHGPPHGPSHGPRHGPAHGPPRLARGIEDGEVEAGVHRGPPRGMMRMRQARGGRQDQHQHGYYYLG